MRSQEIRLSQADLEYLRELVLIENSKRPETRHIAEKLPSDSVMAYVDAWSKYTAPREVLSDDSRSAL